MIRLPAHAAILVLLLAALCVRTAAALGTPFMVKDINPGAASSAPQKLLAIGNRLFFGATDGVLGLEPRVSDGTALGTTLLRDVNPGSSSGMPVGCVDCNAIAIGGTAYFTAFTGTGGSRLWKSDGTIAGTVEVYSAASASDLVDVGGQVFFAGQPIGASVAYLYRCNGTTLGTAQVTNTTFLSGYAMTALNGVAYFPADDFSTGSELWRSDGTPVGTEVVSNLAPGNNNAYPTFITPVGNKLFFHATTGLAAGICVSDGGTAGTALLASVAMVSDRTVVKQIADLNGVALFIASDAAHGYELWRSDGTAGGTFLVKDVCPGTTGGLTESELVRMGNAVYFAARDGVHGLELWKSDGTQAGTVMVKDLYPQFGDFGSGAPAALTNIRGTLFFRATSGGLSGTQPWVSDGTEAGTVELGVVYPGGASQAASFTEVNGTVYFTATDGVHGIELWAVGGLTVGVDPAAPSGASGVSLAASQPNPTSARAHIAYALSASQHVRLRVFDMQGRAVCTLVDTEVPAGSHVAVWDGSGARSGVYFYRLETTAGALERKLLLTH